MIVTVNGKPQEVADDTTVSDLLRHRDVIDTRGLAVAINEEIVHRDQWDVVKVGRGDRIEIVRAVQGG